MPPGRVAAGSRRVATVSVNTSILLPNDQLAGLTETVL